MAIRPNRAYNDPAIGAIASNIAQMFAPPSGGDLAGYATARAKGEETNRLSSLFDYAQGQNFDQATFDRMGQAAGQWNPSNGYYGVDTAATTARRGQDVSAASALAVQGLQNQGALAELYATPVITKEGEVAHIPQQHRAASGLGDQLYGNIAAAQGETIVTPDGRTIAGAPKPMSETEVLGAERQDLRNRGVLTDDMLRDVILSERAPVQVTGPEGPRYMLPGEAARTGAAPYNAPTASGVKTENYITPSGQRGTARIENGRLTDAATGEPLPQGTQTFGTSVQGGADEVGLGKTTNNRVEQSLIDLSVARNTARNLKTLIANSPSSQGIVGWARGTAQNVMQTGGEMGQYFGGGLQEVSEAINSGLADASLAGAFDRNIPAIEMMSNLLAFQYAKTTTGERLSNEMLRAARTALGLDGMLSNQADATARLDTAIDLMDQQEELLLQARRGGVNNLGQANAPAAANAAPEAPPQPGEVMEGYRFKGGDPADPNNWERI